MLKPEKMFNLAQLFVIQCFNTHSLEMRTASLLENKRRVTTMNSTHYNGELVILMTKNAPEYRKKESKLHKACSLLVPVPGQCLAHADSH